jgi:GT2 family glycosyltransferase
MKAQSFWPRLRNRLDSHLPNSAYRVIRSSGLFDRAWYLETYPDVAARNVDPLRHYLRHGVREGRDPNRMFSSSWYLAAHPDVAEAKVNPLLHYITRGAAEGRSTGPVFDTAWYLQANPDVAAAGVNPLRHFLLHGAREGRRPNRGDLSDGWLSASAQIESPHDRNTLHKTFDEVAARRFVAAVRSGRGVAALERDKPLISVVLPTRNRAELLSAAIESVRQQTYPNWELLVVDDASTDSTPALLADLKSDPRIRMLRGTGGGVAAARSLAMAEAKGTLFAYLDSDNAWRPEFLEVAAAYLLAHDFDAVYAALAVNDGWRTRYAGADYDYADLSHRNFIDINIFLHRRALYDQRGGCDATLRRMSDWDVILRYAKDSRIGYAPFIGCAYDGRLTRTDRITVSESAAWIYVVLAKQHIDWSRLRTALSTRDPGLASIVIPIHGQPDLTEACLASLFAVDAGHPFEIVLVDNGSDAATAALLDRWAARPEVTLVRNWENLNFALGCNIGFAASRGGQVVFLNNDTQVRPGWLRALVAPLAEQSIGAVQPKLLYPDGTIQSFGTVIGAHGHLPYELYKGQPGDAPHVSRPRRLNMVTAACVALRAEDFCALGGFDPLYINGQEDNDLCLRLRMQLGKGCLVEPSSIVIHHEGGTPGRGRFAHANRCLFVQRWKDRLQPDDAQIYAEDGFSVARYTPDVAEWAAEGIAAFRPVIEPAERARRPGQRQLHPSIAIKIACPSEAVREEWGDYHFANSLAQAFARLGSEARIDYLLSGERAQPDCDIDLVLRGLERFKPAPSRPAILWVISHPNLVTHDELRDYAEVFVASDRLASRWSAEIGRPIHPLLQCTDRTLFYPDPVNPPRDGAILFVGNSRNVFRPAVHAAIAAGLDPVIYGTRWESLIDPRHIKGTVIPNAAVADLYRSAGVVLNDHWPDMVETGILSNRVFDALACGAPVVSDRMPDVPDDFADFVDQFGPDRPIQQAIAGALHESPGRQAARRGFAEIIRRDHSFDRRAEIILASTRAILAKRG